MFPVRGGAAGVGGGRSTLALRTRVRDARAALQLRKHPSRPASSRARTASCASNRKNRPRHSWQLRHLGIRSPFRFRPSASPCRGAGLLGVAGARCMLTKGPTKARRHVLENWGHLRSSGCPSCPEWDGRSQRNSETLSPARGQVQLLIWMNAQYDVGVLESLGFMPDRCSIVPRDLTMDSQPCNWHQVDTLLAAGASGTHFGSPDLAFRTSTSELPKFRDASRRTVALQGAGRTAGSSHFASASPFSGNSNDLRAVGSTV